MKVKDLRKLIREAIEEQGWVPGRWMPTSGSPVDDEDLDRLGHGGFIGVSVEEVDELGEEKDEEV